MYTCATMAYSIQLQNTLTFVVYKSKKNTYIQTSNKKHFMNNVKECRDVVIKSIGTRLGHSYYTLHTCWTYDTLHRCLILYVV